MVMICATLSRPSALQLLLPTDTNPFPTRIYIYIYISFLPSYTSPVRQGHELPQVGHVNSYLPLITRTDSCTRLSVPPHNYQILFLFPVPTFPLLDRLPWKGTCSSTCRGLPPPSRAFGNSKVRAKALITECTEIEGTNAVVFLCTAVW